MTREKIKKVILDCLNNRRVCRTFLCYDINYRYYFPLITGKNLFLGIEEDDFLLNGYAIRRFKDVIKVQVKDDMCERILKEEGISSSIITPDIDLTCWETVFVSLQKTNHNIIVEKESLDEDKSEFAIGRIEKVYKKHVYIRHFDADGIWQTEPYKIPYTKITTVTFASRYVDTFSKYLDELPDDFGRSIK